MDTRNFKVFTAVYQSRSFSKAADAIFMTPQGVSKIIKKMEDELGQTLFIRTYSGVTPTLEGANLYTKLQKVSDILDDIEHSALAKTKLKIATTVGIIGSLSIQYLEDLKQAFPYTEIKIIEEDDQTIMDDIKKGECDIGIVGGPVNDLEFHLDYFMSQKYVAVINKNNPLAGRETISLKDLDNKDISLLSRKFNGFSAHVNRFVANEIWPKTIYEFTDTAMIHVLSSHDESIGISVDKMARQRAMEENVIVPFSEENMVWNTYFITINNLHESEIYKTFRDFTIKYFQSQEKRKS